MGVGHKRTSLLGEVLSAREIHRKWLGNLTGEDPFAQDVNFWILRPRPL